MGAPTTNQQLINWVDEIAKLSQPANVHWCDGSAAEYREICEAMTATLPHDGVQAAGACQPYKVTP